MALQQGLTKRRQPLSLGSVSPKGRTLRKADRVLLVGASEQVKRRSPEAFEEVGSSTKEGGISLHAITASDIRELR